MGSVYETGPNEYISTPFSKALKDPVYRDGYPTAFVPLFVFPILSIRLLYRSWG